MSLTEYGLKWLAEKHGVPFSGSSPDGSSGRQEEKQESENELVLSLLEQLRQKDIQIAEKDKQIAQRERVTALPSLFFYAFRF